MRLRVVAPEVLGTRASRWFVGSLGVHVALFVGTILWPASSPPLTAGDYVVTLAGAPPPPKGSPTASAPAPEPEQAAPDPTPPNPTPPPEEASVAPNDVRVDDSPDEPDDEPDDTPEPVNPAPPSDGGASDGTTSDGETKPGRPDGVEGGTGPIDGPGVGSDLGSIFGSEHGWWINQVQGILHDNWRRPALPGVRESIRVVIEVDILRDGRIINPRIVQESGIAALDRSAMRAVMDSDPLPAFPRSYSKQVVSPSLSFVWTPE